MKIWIIKVLTANGSSENFIFSDLPEHHFEIETKVYRTGPRSGQIRNIVHLIIPPHKFGKQASRGDFMYFSCISCRSNNTCTIAKARIVGDNEYELIEMPITPHFCK